MSSTGGPEPARQEGRQTPAPQAFETAPRVLITDKLRSYAAAKREIMPAVEHRQHKGLDTIRQWGLKFGREFANRIRRRAPAAATNGTLMRSSSRSPARNRAENSHQPTRRRERVMKRFKSPRQVQARPPKLGFSARSLRCGHCPGRAGLVRNRCGRCFRASGTVVAASQI